MLDVLFGRRGFIKICGFLAPSLTSLLALSLPNIFVWTLTFIVVGLSVGHEGFRYRFNM